MPRPTDPPPPQAVIAGGKALDTIKAMRDGKLSVELVDIKAALGNGEPTIILAASEPPQTA